MGRRDDPSLCLCLVEAAPVPRILRTFKKTEYVSYRILFVYVCIIENQVYNEMQIKLSDLISLSHDLITQTSSPFSFTPHPSRFAKRISFGISRPNIYRGLQTMNQPIKYPIQSVKQLYNLHAFICISLPSSLHLISQISCLHPSYSSKSPTPSPN